jgi:hypothetical protein
MPVTTSSSPIPAPGARPTSGAAQRQAGLPTAGSRTRSTSGPVARKELVEARKASSSFFRRRHPLGLAPRASHRPLALTENG